MSWLSRVNPTPSLPAYSGPYPVGTVDVEVPVADLDCRAPAPDAALTSVAFRVFYPCEPLDDVRPVRWIPAPQRAYVAAYARFLGANGAVASLVSAFPHLLYYATMPAHRNAPLRAAPTATGKWPAMVFSHGLGGSRNAYSHICGSLASYGVIVIAPDHRDCSAPIAYIRTTADIRQAHAVTYQRHAHEPSPEVYAARDKQLRIRLWELVHIHQALTRMEGGRLVRNLNPNSLSVREHDYNHVTSMFHGRMDIEDPGSIIWAGHSFGACTIVQLIKSVCWRDSFTDNGEYRRLLDHPSPASLVDQITPSSPMMLLDMWCLPLRSPETYWLWEKPLPCFSESGPGGLGVLSVSSETFFDWKGNLNDTKRALSPDPTSDAPHHSKPAARMFYCDSSAHHNQSDFGLIFPWLTKKFFGVEEPERILKLNVRAILQVLRENEFDVADTSSSDMEESDTEGELDEKARQDSKILSARGGIRGWRLIDIDQGRRRDGNVVTDKKHVPADEVIEGTGLGGMSKDAVGQASI